MMSLIGVIIAAWALPLQEIMEGKDVDTNLDSKPPHAPVLFL